MNEGIGVNSRKDDNTDSDATAEVAITIAGRPKSTDSDERDDHTHCADESDKSSVSSFSLTHQTLSDSQVRPPVHLVSKHHRETNSYNLHNIDDCVDGEWLSNTD